MQVLQSVFVWIHVIVGFIGLATFWIPVLTRKGGRSHKLYGRVFKYCAYIILLAAALAVLLRLPQFLSVDFTNENEVIFLSFYVFLIYLILVVTIGMRHGIMVLEHKRDITEMDTPVNNTLAILSITASVILIIYALIVSPVNQILLYALSPIGFATGMDIRSAIKNKHQYKQTWLYEHLGAMLGTGIAFHTAFAVFGANQLFAFNLDGALQVIPWIAPALIGVPAISIWTRKYKQRYGDLPAAQVAHES